MYVGVCVRARACLNVLQFKCNCVEFFEPLAEKLMRSNVEWSMSMHNRSGAYRAMFWDDAQCVAALKQLPYGDEFAVHFEAENIGKFKADICRGAVLYLHGGYFLDVDLFSRLPLDEVLFDPVVNFAR